MAGDPWQLGPTLSSPLAEQHGLATSLLERLMASPLYSRGPLGYDGRAITKLIKCFRSHPALVSLPARLYYEDELVSMADPSVVDRLLHFPGLTPGGLGRAPLLLHGVVGREMREGRSPSFFNPTEIVLVLDYISRLVAEGVRPGDIGVIAPYRKQVARLEDRLALTPWGQVTVGTVEQFQGQERLAIIVTTVRSTSDLRADSKHSLGFLTNPKRFNVAITRAQALLVVVGNPHVLAKVMCFLLCSS